MTISVELALQVLNEQMTVVIDARQQYTREIALRDNLIRSARRAGISYPRLVQVTGLSRDRLYTIINEPDKQLEGTD